MSDVTTTTPGEVTQDDKTMAMIACILGLTWWVGPLIIFLLKKDQSKFVAYHALQMLIFEAALCIILIIGAVTIVLSIVTTPLCMILSLVFIILSALAANRGEWYEIPVVGKFAKEKLGITA